MMMKIGDVGGLVSASARAVFACAEHVAWIRDWQ